MSVIDVDRCAFAGDHGPLEAAADRLDAAEMLQRLRKSPPDAQTKAAAVSVFAAW
jgi:hypothetical protein